MFKISKIYVEFSLLWNYIFMLFLNFSFWLIDPQNLNLLILLFMFVMVLSKKL